MPPKDMNRPATCQVPGCDGTYRIQKHQVTGLYICAFCLKQWQRKGTFERKLFESLQKRPPLHGKCENQCGYSGKLRHIATLHVAVCNTCLSHYLRSGDLPNLTPDAQRRALESATCECGKQATHAVRLTGAMLIDNRENKEDRMQSWIEYMCNDCFREEIRMRDWQPPNTYKPTSMIRRA